MAVKTKWQMFMVSPDGEIDVLDLFDDREAANKAAIMQAALAAQQVSGDIVQDDKYERNPQWHQGLDDDEEFFYVVVPLQTKALKKKALTHFGADLDDLHIYGDFWFCGTQVDLFGTGFLYVTKPVITSIE